MFIVCTFLPKQIPCLCQLSWRINPFLILISDHNTDACRCSCPLTLLSWAHSLKQYNPSVQSEQNNHYLQTNCPKTVFVILHYIGSPLRSQDHIIKLQSPILRSGIQGQRGNFKFTTVSLQCHDGGSLLTRIQHHGNSCCTPNLLHGRVCLR